MNDNETTNVNIGDVTCKLIFVTFFIHSKVVKTIYQFYDF